MRKAGLGHVNKPPEDEATGSDGDRGSRNPDDVQGHGAKVRLGQNNEAVDEDHVADDTEGHGRKFRF